LKIVEEYMRKVGSKAYAIAAMAISIGNGVLLAAAGIIEPRNGELSLSLGYLLVIGVLFSAVFMGFEAIISVIKNIYEHSPCI